jgi:hypothetical protein
VNKVTGIYWKMEPSDKVMIVTTLTTLIVWFIMKGKKYV